MFPEVPLEVALAVLTRGDRVLLQMRGAGAYEGWWEFPGGKLEPGESPAAAAVRETREELGIVVRDPTFLMMFEHRYEGGPWVRLHAFHVVADDEVRETPTRRWVRYGDVGKHKVLEGTLPILAALHR